jgi:hypothetical protein
MRGVESSEIAVHADEVHVPERLIVAPAGGVFRATEAHTG